jgi:hypothetical protein
MRVGVSVRAGKGHDPTQPPTPHPCLQEEAQKVDRQAEEQEKVKMAAAVWNFDGHPRRFREILSRRKKKKGERLRCPGVWVYDSRPPKP